MTDHIEHEHQWQYVQQQSIYEGFGIANLETEGDDDTQELWVVVDSSQDADWQEAEGVLSHKVSCIICNEEYPYPTGGWQVEWQNLSR